MVGKNTRRAITLLSAMLTGVGTVVAYKLTKSLDESQSWVLGGAWMVAGIIITYVVSRLQARSEEDSPEAIKERVSQLIPELRKQVQARSYGARRQLIEAPLRELDLDITPRLGWVRDPRLVEPEPVSEEVAHDIVTAFESSKRRLLIVGEPGSGKTMAAYSLIEYLDNTEGDERIPLLVNLSAWEAQDTFEAFLIDYLCASVGYEVHERAVARAFIGSGRYNFILDGLDEIPPRLRQHFSERLDDFIRRLPGEVAVVVTCRTEEYEEMLVAHPTGLGLVQAVEILPLTGEQLDSALAELAKLDEDWQALLLQRHLAASQLARDVLSNPLFLNLAVAGHVHPRELLECDEEQEVRDLVLDSFLDRTLADQKHYKPEDARRYLSWIARFLDGDEVSPFGLKTSDFTVFDLANLTPPDPPRRYRLFGGLGIGLIWGLLVGEGVGLVPGLIVALVLGLVIGLPTGWPFKRSAVSSRLTLVWPSTKRQLSDFLRRAGRGLIWGLKFGLSLGLVLVPVFLVTAMIEESRIFVDAVAEEAGLDFADTVAWLVRGLVAGLVFGLVAGLVLGLVLAPVSGLLETRSVLITSRTPKEARTRSLMAALTWLLSWLLWTVVFGLVDWHLNLTQLFWPLSLGLSLGLIFALRNGGWFVLLQKIAQLRLARAGNLPPNPYAFLEWGVEQQIFRRVGGGVRFRHNLIQQHLAKDSEDTNQS